MYTFRQIRSAVLAAGGPPPGFPYGAALAPEQIAALREAPHMQGFLSEARALAQEARTTPLEVLPFSRFRIFEDVGTRKEYEVPYFARRGRLAALTVATLVDATDDYLEALQDTVWAICDEFSWCLPAHIGRGAGPARVGHWPPEQVVDLFAAETGHALAETLTLLDGRLSPWVAYRIRAEIERRIFRPLFHDPVHFHWESVPMNWASVCAGAAGMAALLLERDAERLAGMVERCCRAMECFLEGYADDGGCPEGIGYWQYGFGYYVYFAEMLHTYTRGALDLLEGEKIRRIASFPAGISLSGGNFVNYSDGAARTTLHTGLVSRLAERTGCAVPELARVPSFHSDHCYRWPHIFGNLLWTDASLLGQPTPAGTSFFEDLGWVLDRRYVGGVPVAFSAKGGHNAEPHNQNDLGNFILHVGGESLLADLGAGLYTRQYFGPQRYEHIHNRSLGHSVPLVEGQEQGAGREYKASVISCEQRGASLLFSVDLTKAYPAANLRRLVRSFAWGAAGPGEYRLALADAFSFAEPPSAIEEVFISLREPEVAPGRVTWRGERGLVELSFDAGRLAPATESIESQDHDARPIVVHRLRLRAVAPQPEDEYRLTFAVRPA